MNNTLFDRIVKNHETFDEEFDVTFADLVATLIDSKPNKRRKTVKDLIPDACNDL